MEKIACIFTYIMLYVNQIKIALIRERQTFGKIYIMVVYQRGINHLANILQAANHTNTNIRPNIPHGSVPKKYRIFGKHIYNSTSRIKLQTFYNLYFKASYKTFGKH